jgi:hypoxanthine phosphoribosyltransferase
MDCSREIYEKKWRVVVVVVVVRGGWFLHNQRSFVLLLVSQ